MIYDKLSLLFLIGLRRSYLQKSKCYLEGTRIRNLGWLLFSVFGKKFLANLIDASHSFMIASLHQKYL